MFDSKPFLRSLTRRPGVYRMLDKNGVVLYVGKANNLKRRVSSYFNRGLTTRLQRMVGHIASIEITITNTETEALLLENTIIKTLQPRYNVLLRDDKSYPYIILTIQHPFPRLALHRGNKRAEHRYFGPYPSAKAVRETLRLLQRLFPVRQCEDALYRNRTRPCLEYQLKRCSGPCVGLVTSDAYAQEIKNSVLFLEGRASQLIDNLAISMDTAAQQLEFEEAARMRDRINTLRKIQERQYVSGESGNMDVVALALQHGSACIQVFWIRDGRVLGNQAYFPHLPDHNVDAEDPQLVMAAFLAQHYLGQPLPAEILVTHLPTDVSLLEDAFTTQAGRKIIIRSKPRGERLRWLKLALDNAITILKTKLAGRISYADRLSALQKVLNLPTVPNRLECFDISHTSGELPVAACVVFDTAGPRTSEYRRFNINNIVPGDDYAALKQALTRRYQRIANGETPLPDVLCIDGGRGQLQQAETVLQELGLEVSVVLGIAKGPGRTPGLEQLWLSGQQAPLILPPHSSALHALQQLRDEAHRFAITGHKQRRARVRNTSMLEEIPGIGPKRRQQLLKRFGGLPGLTHAGVDDIAAVPGIGPTLAQQVYAALH